MVCGGQGRWKGWWGWRCPENSGFLKVRKIKSLQEEKTKDSHEGDQTPKKSRFSFGSGMQLAKKQQHYLSLAV